MTTESYMIIGPQAARDIWKLLEQENALAGGVPLSPLGEMVLMRQIESIINSYAIAAIDVAVKNALDKERRAQMERL